MKSTESNIAVKWRFGFKPFVIFLIVFIVEVIIAKFVNDSFVRPYGGDVLVVVLMYYFVKSFIQIKSLYIVLGATLFAYLVEVAQYFHLVEILDMQDNKIMRTVIGSSFSWGDIFVIL